MGQVIVTSNLGWTYEGTGEPLNETQGFLGSPGYGISPFDSNLNGAKNLTWLVRFCCPGYAGYLGDLTPGDFGFPIVNQCVAAKGSTANARPQTGWGIWAHSAAISFVILNGYDGSTASTYKKIHMEIFGPSGKEVSGTALAGRWCSAAISLSSTGTLLRSADGIGSRGTVTGTLATPGTLGATLPPPLRWFHSSSGSYPNHNAWYPGAAGVWIYNAALDQTALNNLTKESGASGWQDPDTVASLYRRSYLGVPDWRALPKAGEGYVGKYGTHGN